MHYIRLKHLSTLLFKINLRYADCRPTTTLLFIVACFQTLRLQFLFMKKMVSKIDAWKQERRRWHAVVTVVAFNLEVKGLLRYIAGLLFTVGWNYFNSLLRRIKWNGFDKMNWDISCEPLFEKDGFTLGESVDCRFERYVDRIRWVEQPASLSTLFVTFTVPTFLLQYAQRNWRR